MSDNESKLLAIVPIVTMTPGDPVFTMLVWPTITTQTPGSLEEVRTALGIVFDDEDDGRVFDMSRLQVGAILEIDPSGDEDWIEVRVVGIIDSDPDSALIKVASVSGEFINGRRTEEWRVSPYTEDTRYTSDPVYPTPVKMASPVLAPPMTIDDIDF